MAHTNSTPNYNLPQFLGTDKPAWLTDVNNAMSDIDTAIAAAKTTADTADAAASALAVTVGNHTSQLSTLSGAVTSQGNTLNTVTSLIGNGTPTTTDQTIIGAINELHANQGDLANLTTVDKSSLVAAINEAAQGGGATASGVSYDNTGSGLTATNVQDAIDEIAQGGGSADKIEVNYTTSQTWTQIITALKNAADLSKVSAKSVIDMGAGGAYFTLNMSVNDPSVLTFTMISAAASELRAYAISLINATYHNATCAATYNRTDISSNNPAANGTITLYY